jgi:carboxymethylenebutenolidase
MRLVALLVLVAAAAGARTPEPMEQQWLGILSESEFKALHELTTEEVPPLAGEMIEFAGGVAYVSLPEGEGPHPGILVIQEWWGINDNIKHWSDRLAADGYIAVAVDLYDGGIATTREEAYAAMQAVEDARAHEILRAGLDHLNELGATKLGSVGWCFGGGWSLNAALANPEIEACVIYYGRLVDDVEALGKIGGAVCGVFGNEDQGIPPETVDAFAKALNSAGVPNEIHRYDAQHAFANPSSGRYDEGAAGNAWEKVRVFLAANLKTE